MQMQLRILAVVMSTRAITPHRIIPPCSTQHAIDSKHHVGAGRASMSSTHHRLTRLRYDTHRNMHLGVCVVRNMVRRLIDGTSKAVWTIGHVLQRAPQHTMLCARTRTCCALVFFSTKSCKPAHQHAQLWPIWTADICAPPAHHAVSQEVHLLRLGLFEDEAYDGRHILFNVVVDGPLGATRREQLRLVTQPIACKRCVESVRL
jgi:hypothetical protein